jgi:putative endonuclease
MGWMVYMLRCSDGSMYTGATNDLARRLKQHQAGLGSAYTRARLPVQLVFSEPARGRSAALRREWAFKRLTRAEKLALLRRRCGRRLHRRISRSTAPEQNSNDQEQRCARRGPGNLEADEM